ncbi:hypothetical protein DPMN_043136 [Dreissena polymorpha]|uniref:Uncharacterized protein n=1 Tax=Dreissena polymorpha TaxID=45954 RepID=A0A9D4D229_DREPO|nr:hypothetical protein DPMN_043136 [Dreissena polymorpha]
MCYVSQKLYKSTVWLWRVGASKRKGPGLEGMQLLLLSFHMQPNCALKCVGAVDSTHCPGFYSGKCEVWTNVPVECPKMCKWCPYADKQFLK